MSLCGRRGLLCPPRPAARESCTGPLRGQVGLGTPLERKWGEGMEAVWAAMPGKRVPKLTHGR